MYKSMLSKIVLLFALLATAGAAEPEMHLSSKQVRAEVRAVVEAQLAALRTGDFSAAYAYAAAGIKARFEEEVFAAMIRRGYPLLLSAKSADLGVVRDQDGELAQLTVTVPDRQKRSVVYRYWLVREEEGWRITAVTLEQRPERGDI
jgi:Domain of unknown function (DUF4864)